MAGNTKIEWTEKTWNPVTGCSKVSEDAETVMLKRWLHDFKKWGIRDIRMVLQ